MPAIHTINVTQQQIYQEYEITATASPTSGQLLNFQTSALTGGARESQTAIIEARGDNIVFKFGTATVASSASVVSNALVAGNFSVPNGAVFIITLNGATQNYVSVVSQGSGGTAIVRLARSNL